MSDINLTGPELSRLMNALKEQEPKAARLVRRNIREAAKVAAEDVKSTLQQGGGTSRTGVRRAIASGVAVRISTGKRADVRVVASSKALPANRKAMLRLYNKRQWRHPVFGTDKWVTQSGRPYFRAVLDKHRDDVERAVVDAMNEANSILMRSTAAL